MRLVDIKTPISLVGQLVSILARNRVFSEGSNFIMQLYFIRHAQSENNVIWAQTQSENGRFPDPDITAIGHQQADCLANFLATKAEFQFTHLYTSLMSRAVSTGSYISKTCRLPLVAWEEIHERGGIFQIHPESGVREGLPGANRAYFEQRFPDFLLPNSLGNAGWWKRPFEQKEDSSQRVKLVLQELLRRHGGTDDKVAMVSHAGFGYDMLQALLRFTSPNSFTHSPMHVWIRIQNTSIFRIDFESDYFSLVYLNRLEHLPTKLIT